MNNCYCFQNKILIVFLFIRACIAIYTGLTSCMPCTHWYALSCPYTARTYPFWGANLADLHCRGCFLPFGSLLSYIGHTIYPIQLGYRHSLYRGWRRSVTYYFHRVPGSAAKCMDLPASGSGDPQFPSRSHQPELHWYQNYLRENIRRCSDLRVRRRYSRAQKIPHVYSPTAYSRHGNSARYTISITLNTRLTS